MIFAIQTYLEDYFSNRGLSDADHYAVSLSRLYDRSRHGMAEADFLSAMKKIRTVFYKRNNGFERKSFERKLLNLLDGRFKKKDCCSSQKHSPQGLRSPVPA